MQYLYSIKTENIMRTQWIKQAGRMVVMGLLGGVLLGSCQKANEEKSFVLRGGVETLQVATASELESADWVSGRWIDDGQRFEYEVGSWWPKEGKDGISRKQWIFKADGTGDLIVRNDDGYTETRAFNWSIDKKNASLVLDGEKVRILSLSASGAYFYFENNPDILFYLNHEQ